MKIIMRKWLKGKSKEEIVDIKPFKNYKDIILFYIDTEGIYFNAQPILGSILANNKTNPHITIFCKEKGPKGKDFNLEIIFSEKYKDVFACSTTKDLIMVCLIK